MLPRLLYFPTTLFELSELSITVPFRSHIPFGKVPEQERLHFRLHVEGGRAAWCCSLPSSGRTDLVDNVTWVCAPHLYKGANRDIVLPNL